ncbi:NADH oxidase [Fertoebacter nigrum]|uniref:NADH oxidase n=1 Tax=Fertoeibacter niger TaxID=2656921 RepID=A0A8X8KQY4_9RHOB|nr:NADH oxidase [Fertoeibacter niger]NUB46476.1 NADH oxidase [Fertoeibacter niger]
MTLYPDTTTRIESTITEDRTLRLELVQAPVPEPRADEVVVRVEAAPINPTDIGLMLSAADVSTLQRIGNVTKARIPEAAMDSVRWRLGRAKYPGSEGAGTVVAAGADAKELIGRVVAVSQQIYAGYRTLGAVDCTVLPANVTAVAGAGALVNPLTVLGFIETMRLEGHHAIINTAAASNLGQMLVRQCAAEGIPLVSIVRRPEHAEMLKKIGGKFVCDLSSASFDADLRAAISATGATLAFDAVGADLTPRLMTAMNKVLLGQTRVHSQYGSPVRKKVYVYGTLDVAPIPIRRDLGMAWSVEGWLLYHFLERIGSAAADRLRRLAAQGVTGTFASHFNRTITLSEAIEPAVIRDYAARATQNKFLIVPDGS